MVSLRRRKLLGLCAGRSSFLTPLPRSAEPGTSPASPAQNVRSVAVHPLPSNDTNDTNLTEEKPIAKAVSGSPNVSASGSSKEVHPEPYPEPPVKRRKRHRRKHVHNQEPCLMRGVYFKNMKWQAAIKVDKKQIHLGTVGSQVEAARLYDRAAFMCGREPNFDLSEAEKRELRQFKWEEFLAITRSAINNKKSKKRTGPQMKKKSDPNPQSENWNGNQETNSFSSSEEMEQDSSAS